MNERRFRDRSGVPSMYSSNSGTQRVGAKNMKYQNLMNILTNNYWFLKRISLDSFFLTLSLASFSVMRLPRWNILTLQ